ncbi:DUF58 domain-containing protein [Alkalicoccus urumqiensis]|uniref:DUF58 domain-containing protein n=1 Tax=Alkalicoccus urumqiensis TaxID=1548213 RepID=A0A2P6MJ35_ALKUR|nr:DUF58 domain-containing protein [Alkalicoccus urumqiensis]PRO66263.1 DUF58 domain-containing protein [Alkalicoccus urumqiensis]
MKQIGKWLTRLLKLLIILAAAGGLFSYAMFQGNFVSWFLFYSVAVLLLLMFLYALLPLGKITVDRNGLNGAQQSGSPCTVTIRIRRSLLFPFLYLAVEDIVDEELQRQLPGGALKKIFYSTASRELMYTYHVPELKRGRYRGYGIRLQTSDMFGVFTKSRFLPLADELLVYPKHHEIQGWDVYERSETETKQSLQDMVEDRTAIAGAREYEPGDRLTSLDWKASARAGKLMTKEFEEFIGRQFLVVWDNRLESDAFAGQDAYEKGIELAASIIMYAYREHLQVGMWAVGSSVVQYPVGFSEEQRRRMMAWLAQARPSPESSFVKAVQPLEQEIPDGVTLVYITARLDDSVVEQLRRLAGRQVRMVCALMDKQQENEAWETRRLEQVRSFGIQTYLLQRGSLHQESGESRRN